MSEFVDLDHARALDDVDGHRLALPALDGPRMGHVLGVHALDGDMPLHGIVEFMWISPSTPGRVHLDAQPAHKPLAHGPQNVVHMQSTA
jgi:hypothetical protein